MRTTPAILLLHHDNNSLHSLYGQTVRQGWDDHTPLRILATRHGDRTVVEQAEGDVYPGCNTGPQGLAAGVEVRAIADVLDDVTRLGKWRCAHPGHAFTTHLRQIAGMPSGLLDQTAHAVAADAATDDLAFQR